jgi:hypothetical protein
MTLTFPNQSRSYDESRRQVRFVGHEGMFEIPFRIDIDAVTGPKTDDLDEEEACLAAFDKKRAAIERAASDAHSHGRKPIYILTAAHVR